MTRVQVKPELLRWACERSRIDEIELTVRFPQVEAWERGEKQPTIKQLEAFAKATHTPLGYFFLPEPPVERLPIQDFRTLREDGRGLVEAAFTVVAALVGALGGRCGRARGRRRDRVHGTENAVPMGAVGQGDHPLPDPSCAGCVVCSI